MAELSYRYCDCTNGSLQLAKESGTTVKEILQLVDRELNLLARGMMSSTLSGLQSRLRALMRRYIQSKLPQEMP